MWDLSLIKNGLALCVMRKYFWMSISNFTRLNLLVYEKHVLKDRKGRKKNLLTWLLMSALFCSNTETNSLCPLSQAQCRRARPCQGKHNK